MDRQERRGRLKGRVFRRGRIWWIAYCHRGREIRESTRAEDEGKAWKLLEARQKKTNTPHFVDPKIERVTFDELAEAYLRDYRIKGKVLRHATGSVKNL